MALYFYSAAASFLISFGVIFLLKNFANNKKIFLTKIRLRDMHSKPTPRVGGIGIVIAFLLVTLGLYQINPDWFSFINETVLGIDRNFFGLILAVLVLFAVNVVDDFKGVGWAIKLLVQIIAALLIAAFGVKVGWLTTFGWELALNGYFAWIFIVVWLISLANVVNWLDASDGLAGGVVAIALAVLFFLSIRPDVSESGNALLGAVTFGAVIGFLPHNFMNNKVFMGDTGSVFLGFIIGIMAIISGGKVMTAFLVIAIPFLDALVVFGTRILKGQSPFLPDQRHLPHRLFAMGLKVWQVNLLYYGTSLFFGMMALNTQTSGKIYTGILAVAMMAGLVLIYSRSMLDTKK